MPKGEAWHRKHAIQLAAQLPDDPEDALLVLELTKQLVDKFLGGRGTYSSPVLAFSSATVRSADASLKLRPSSRPK